jgi:hypothetical protein
VKKLTFKQHLVTSAVCTAIIGIIVACGGGHTSIVGGLPPTVNPLAHLFSHSQAGYHSHILPGSSSSSPVLASMFFFFAASDIPESFEVACTFSPGFMATVPPGNIIPLIPAQSTGNDCSRFFSVPQPASSLTGLTPLFHAGTAQTLVINGKTAGGVLVRCSDLTNQTAVADNDLVPAYLDPATNTIHLFNNITQLANSCQLPVPGGDSLSTVTVRWAKL